MPCSNPVRKKKRLGAEQPHRLNPVPRTKKPPGNFYRPRNHETPFFKIVHDYFDEFERVYPERYQAKYGYWRPVIRTSINKFLKCGDLKEGFARVRCPDCHEEFFVAFSCRQRSCCPTCDQKRALLLGHRLKAEVFEDVPHRQWVFTIPKRLRVCFRFDRSLLGKLCRAAYDTVRDVYALEIDGNLGIPAMVGAVQTFGDLIHWHSHIHAIVADGVFTESGHFVRIAETWKHRAIEIWQDKVFDMLLDEKKIDPDTVEGMREWKHSGFSVDNSVIIEAEDKDGMQRLVEYISRCPFSLTRMISITKEGDILYRASNPQCIAFPIAGDQELTSGNPRNFEVFNPHDFLANVSQHIPDKGEHQIRYYGFYSNKKRGMREKNDMSRDESLSGVPNGDTSFVKKRKITWAALIKCVYEVDPLKCPKCGGTMKIISFIERHPSDVIEKILRHCNLWKEELPRPPPSEKTEPKPVEPKLDYGFFEQTCL